MKCPFDGCDKTFKCYNGLYIHKQTIHERVEEYRCEWPGCEYKTYSKIYIDRHRVVHSDDKPFVCHWPGCQLRTKFTNNLRAHVKLHK